MNEKKIKIPLIANVCTINKLCDIFANACAEARLGKMSEDVKFAYALMAIDLFYSGIIPKDYYIYVHKHMCPEIYKRNMSEGYYDAFEN